MNPRHAQEQKMKVSWAAQFLSTARVSVTAVRENAPVLLMTGIAFGGSYGHIAELCGRYGPHGWVQYATAGCVDLLCVIGAEERQRDKRIGRARNGKKVTWPTVILFIGILVTLAANAATADRSFLGYCVAAWPAAALLLAVSILERRASYEIPLRIEHDELQAALEAERERADAAEAHAAKAETWAAGAETDRNAAYSERDAALAEAAESVARAEAAQRQAEAAQAALEERLQGGTGGGTAPPKSARHKAGSAARGSTKTPEAQAAEIVTHAEAEIILAAEPGISGSELGRRLGTTPGYGRTLKRKLTQVGQGGGG